MAQAKTAEEDKQQRQADDYREILQNAYSFVEGQRSVQTFAAKTPEDLMAAFVERIEGKDTAARPNVLNRYKKIKTEVLATIEKVKAIPASAFRKPDNSASVNPTVFYAEETIKGEEDEETA